METSSFTVKKRKRQKKGKNYLPSANALTHVEHLQAKKVIRRLAASFYSKCQEQSVASFFFV
jgi:hypothetical protein